MYKKWVSITLNTSMYNKPRAKYNRRKVLHTPSFIYSRGFFILCKKNIFGWAGVKGLLLRAEGGQLKARHTATSVSHVGWAGVKRLLLRADGGQFWHGTNISRASRIFILAYKQMLWKVKI